MLPFPDNINARLITADPPIPFKAWSHKGEGRSPQHHYRCEEFEQLAAIPVANLAAKDCFLLMWVPKRSIDWVKPLMKAWGFDFSGPGFTWVRLNKKADKAVAAALRTVAPTATKSDRERLEGFFMGGGYGTRQNTETPRQPEAEIEGCSGADHRASARTFPQARRDLCAVRGLK